MKLTVDSIKDKVVDTSKLPWVITPLPKTFYVDPTDWKALLYCMATGKNCLLVGPSGQGKSEIVYTAHKALNLTMDAFNLGAMSDPRTSLIGNINLNKDTGTYFSESRFVQAIQKENHVILLDEVTRAVPAAFNILLPLLDNQGYLALDEKENSPIVRKTGSVSFIGTANVGVEFTGTGGLDEALKNRMHVIIDVGFPPPDSEAGILMNNSKGLDVNLAKQVVKLANVQRELWKKGDMSVPISTRMLIELAKKLTSNFTASEAIKYSVANHFSNDGGAESERAKILQQMQNQGL